MPYGLRGADEATLEIFGGRMRVKDGGLDASKLAVAATQTISADGFTLQHNNAAVLDLTQTGVFATHVSDATTAIADGVRVGQVLLKGGKEYNQTNNPNREPKLSCNL